MTWLCFLGLYSLARGTLITGSFADYYSALFWISLKSNLDYTCSGDLLSNIALSWIISFCSGTNSFRFSDTILATIFLFIFLTGFGFICSSSFAFGLWYYSKGLVSVFSIVYACFIFIGLTFPGNFIYDIALIAAAGFYTYLSFWFSFAGLGSILQILMLSFRNSFFIKSLGCGARSFLSLYGITLRLGFLERCFM